MSVKTPLLRLFVNLLVIVSVISGEPTSYQPNVTKVLSNYYDSGHYSEGPAFDKNGNFYVMLLTLMGPPGGGIFKVDLVQKKLSLLVEPKVGSYNGLPNGASCDKDGTLWVTDLRLGLLKVTPDGKYQQMMTRDSSNETIQGFNDIAIDYTGNMWITAPVGKIAPQEYYNGLDDAAPSGSLYSYLPQQDKLVKLDTGLRYPNGIAVQHSKDGQPAVLLVAEMFAKTMWAYDITGPGEVSVTSKRIWATLPGTHWGGFDGIDLDAEGNLLVTNVGASSIEVFGPKGGMAIGQIRLPFTNVTNLEFKPGTHQVYVTELDNDSGALWTFEWKNKGMDKFKELATNAANDVSSGWFSLFPLFLITGIQCWYM